MAAAPGPERRRVLVVGAGMAGLAAALSAVEAGADVILLSRHPATRSGSSAFHGGFNASDGDPAGHLADALAWGGPGASPAVLRARAEAAMELADWLAALGLPFDREGAGFLRQRLPGASRPLTLGAGAAFGRQLLHALDGQARRLEREGRLMRAEGWHLVDLARDGQGRCRGAVAVHVNTLDLRPFPADAVILAAGGAGWLVKPTACAMESNGAAVGLAHRLGARLQDADRLAWGAAVQGPDKDLAVPSILLAMAGGPEGASLDLRGLSKVQTRRWGGGFPRLATIFSGRNPAGEALPLRPAVTGTLGGLRIDARMATDIPDLYAAGEAACGGFGARALPGDEALAWIHQGRVAGRQASEGEPSGDPFGPSSAAATMLEARLEALRRGDGPETPAGLFANLSEILSGALGARTADAPEAALEALSHRAAGLGVADRAFATHGGLMAALDLPSCLVWTRSAIACAAHRAAHPAGPLLNATWTEGGPAVTTEAVAP